MRALFPWLVVTLFVGASVVSFASGERWAGVFYACSAIINVAVLYM